MIPPCYNRPPAAAGNWELVGRHARTGKPHYRWRPRWFEDCCTQHDGAGIGPNGESYAAANGFECAGCRWEPARIRQAREFEARMRRPIPRLVELVDNPVDRPMVIHISTPLGLASSYESLAKLAKAEGLGYRHLLESGQAAARMSAAAMAAVNFSARPHGPPDDRL